MAQSALKRLAYQDYGIAIICALEVEVSAVRYMMDEEHANLDAKEGDPTGYYFGSMSGHNVVMGYLPPSAPGGCMAATVATNMKRSFPHISLRILVGIGGGVPSEIDIRLGDVVVSMPKGVHGGVVQYDLGKATLTGFHRQGLMEPPDIKWRNAVVKLQSAHRTSNTRIPSFIDIMVSKYPGLILYRRPELQDVLFKSTCLHQSSLPTCRNCDHTQLVERPHRPDDSPHIFYGLIASGNTVVKNASERDKIAQDIGGALCFEMEAAGLMNDLRCLVVRGISDYADSHKNDDWHAYAAAVAAGYAKELLMHINPPSDVGDRTSAERSFLSIATKLGVHASNAQDVCQILANSENTWLLILDNADDDGFDYQQYFPSGGGGVILLTSRVRECQRYATQQAIMLEGLSSSDAVALLFKVAHVQQSDSVSVLSDSKKIATGLFQGHPLALIQAGAYMLRRRCSPSEYLVIFQRERQKLLTYKLKQAQPRYRDVYATFEASANVLQSSSDEVANDALELLDIFSTVAPNQFPLSLFKAAWEGAQEVLSESDEAIDQDDEGSMTSHKDLERLLHWHIRHMPSMIGAYEPAWNDSRLLDAVDLLEVYSLIIVTGRGDNLCVSMHPLTHAWTRDRQNKKQQQLSWCKTSCIVALSYQTPSYWYECGQNLRPHLSNLVSTEPDIIFNSGPLILIARTILRCTWLLQIVRLDENLYDLGQQIFRYFDLENTHKKMIWLPFYQIIGSNLEDIGKSKESVALLELVTTEYDRILPEDDLYRLASQHELAIAYDTDGQVERAEALLEDVVRMQEQTLAEDDSFQLASQHALAEVYRTNGKVEQAVALLEHVVKIEGQTLADDHPSRLASQFVLARAYDDNGQTEPAIALFEHVARIREQTLVEDHPSRLATQHSLALAYNANGQIEQAVALLEHVVGVEGRVLPEGHPDRLISQRALTKLLWQVGRTDEAIQLLQEVVDLYRGRYDEFHSGRRDAEKWLDMMLRKDVAAEPEAVDSSGPQQP